MRNEDRCLIKTSKARAGTMINESSQHQCQGNGDEQDAKRDDRCIEERFPEQWIADEFLEVRKADEGLVLR